jgi:hypothetical protein
MQRESPHAQQDEWKQVTPKKQQVTERELSNKFLVLSKEPGNSFYENSLNSSSSKSVNNRFNALVSSSSSNTGGGKSSIIGTPSRNASSQSSLNYSRTPDLSQSGAQAALQKQIQAKLHDLRKKHSAQSTAGSSPSSSPSFSTGGFLSSPKNFKRVAEFTAAFQWDYHGAKLENLWFSVLGNPQKFIFIILDYFEDLFSGDIFPSVTCSASNFMDDLPVDCLASTSSASVPVKQLIEHFRGKIEVPLETFVRSKLESPEFKIEDVVVALLEIMYKSQRLKDGANSFASMLILSRLIKIFPFQSLLALKEFRQRTAASTGGGFTLKSHGYFYLWAYGLIFEEEPSQCGVIVDVLLADLVASWEQVPLALLTNAIGLLEDLTREVVHGNAGNVLLMKEVQGKLLKFIQVAGIKAQQQPLQIKNMKNYNTLAQGLASTGVCILGEGMLRSSSDSNEVMHHLLGEIFKLSFQGTIPVAEDKAVGFMAELLDSDQWGDELVATLLADGASMYQKGISSGSKRLLTLLASPGTQSWNRKGLLRRLVKELKNTHTGLGGSSSSSSNGSGWSKSQAEKSGGSKRDVTGNDQLLDRIEERLEGHDGNDGDDGKSPTKKQRQCASKRCCSGSALSVLVLLIAMLVSLLMLKVHQIDSCVKYLQQSPNKHVSHLGRLIQSGRSKVDPLVATLKPKAVRLAQWIAHCGHHGYAEGTKAIVRYKPHVVAFSRRYQSKCWALVSMYQSKCTALSKRYFGQGAVSQYKDSVMRAIAILREYYARRMN